MELTTEAISSLAKIMSEEHLTSLEIDQGNLIIKLKRDPQLNQNSIQENTYQSEVAEHRVMNFLEDPKKETSDFIIDLSIIEIKSPIVGVFYQSSEPNADPYVTLNQTFSEGDTLCIIEAMKLMNEIVAESSGTIIEICVKDGQVVEYGQILYRIKEGK
jgi:acetyl-CoA carboxylase biotin carboxyl carrier protein